MRNEAPQWDWPRIAAEYRSGIKSTRELSREFGPSEAMIRKKAKQEGWVRDLGARVRARAQEMVRSAQSAQPSTQEVRTEEQLVEDLADQMRSTQTAQETRLERSLAVLDDMLEELTGMRIPTDQRVTLAIAIKKASEADGMSPEAAKDLLKQLFSAVSLDGRADVMRKLGETITRLTTLQRSIKRMDADTGKGNAWEEAVKMADAAASA